MQEAGAGVPPVGAHQLPVSYWSPQAGSKETGASMDSLGIKFFMDEDDPTERATVLEMLNAHLAWKEASQTGATQRTCLRCKNVFEFRPYYLADRVIAVDIQCPIGGCYSTSFKF